MVYFGLPDRVFATACGPGDRSTTMKLTLRSKLSLPSEGSGAL